MKLSPQDRLIIAENAASLDRRLNYFANLTVPQNGSPAETRDPDEEQLIQRRLKEWKAVLSDDSSAEVFNRRLAWDNIDIHTTRRALSEEPIYNQSPAFMPLPSWLETLDRFFSFCSRAVKTKFPVSSMLSESKYRHGFLSSQYPMPFEELCAYFVLYAREQLSDRAGYGYQLLSTESQDNFERGLLQVLCQLSHFSLEMEFSVYRYKNRSVRDMFGSGETTDSGDLYAGFLSQLIEGGGLISLFKEYSVLAKLTARFTEAWIHTTAIFLRRFRDDWPDLCRTFGMDESKPGILKVRSYLSDLHRGGYSVIAFKIGSGPGLVYKPRDVGMEESYYRLLDWFNQKSITAPFMTLDVLNRGSHGWIGYVQPEPFSSKDQVRDFLFTCRSYFIYTSYTAGQRLSPGKPYRGTGTTRGG